MTTRIPEHLQHDPEVLGACFELGYREGLGDDGMTYDGDPESPRSVAYDLGRSLRRALEGLEVAPWRALREIREILSGKEWSSDTPEAIAEAMTRGGFVIAPYDPEAER